MQPDLRQIRDTVENGGDPGLDPPRVMRLVVDDQGVPCAHHLTEHVADKGFVALHPKLVDAACAGEVLIRLPIERAPVVGEAIPSVSVSRVSCGPF